MIPYFQLTAVPLGPLQIHFWGLFVSLGLLAAILFGYRLARKFFLSGELLVDMAIWAIIGALAMARIFHVIFYEPAYYLVNPGEIIKFWNGGASSSGGFFGAALAVYIFAKVRRLKFPELRPYFDVSAVSFWLGWGIGRIGCFVTHMHPGRLSNFFLAVDFPDGSRLDMGLIESAVAFIFFGLVALTFKKLVKRGWGLVSLISAAAYAIIRFFLDFLRATDLPESDARYGGLTPAQWGMLALLFALTFVVVWSRFKRQNGRVA